MHNSIPAPKASAVKPMVLPQIDTAEDLQKHLLKNLIMRPVSPAKTIIERYNTILPEMVS